MAHGIDLTAAVPSWASVLTHMAHRRDQLAQDVYFRPSGRSISGWVAVLIFDELPPAGAASAFFAAALPPRCQGAAVRRDSKASLWFLSVPVSGFRHVACRWTP